MTSSFTIHLRSVLSYGSAFLLVFIYVNLFVVWRWFNDRLSQEVMAILPIIITFFCLILIITFLRRMMTKGFNVDWKWAAAGILFCLIALVFSNPDFPIKRIHVPEYMALSLLLRYAMSMRLQGLKLLFFSAAATMLLGIHDELLQGFHPSRTYGLGDIFTDCSAAAGGAMIWHSCKLFLPAVHVQVETTSNAIDTRAWIFLLYLFVAVCCLIIPLVDYRNIAVPYWPFLPIVSALVFYIFYNNLFSPEYRYGITILSLFSFLFLFYFPAPYVVPLFFY